MAYGDETEIKCGDDRYCYFDEEIWIWRTGLYCWVAVDDCPIFLTVVNERLAIVDVMSGDHYCNCPRYVLLQSGCICAGK